MLNYESNHLLLENHPLFLNISIIDYHNAIRNHELIGSGKIYLCFNYMDFHKENSYGEGFKVNHINLQPVENYFKFSAEKGAKLITMGIKPQFWYNITRIKAKKSSTRHFDMNSILDAELASSLYKAIQNTSTPHKALKLIDANLAEYYPIWTKPTPLDKLIEDIFESKGEISISQILKKYPFARSTLNAHFEKYIGLSPKFYIRLINFNYILREHFVNKKCLADIIRDWNYYDYSHFKKDMVQFTGISPAEAEHYRNESIDGLFEKISYW